VSARMSVARLTAVLPRSTSKVRGNAREVDHADLVGSHRLENEARVGTVRELAGEVDLGDVREQGVGTRKSVLDEGPNGSELSRMRDELGESACDELCVEDLDGGA